MRIRKIKIKNFRNLRDIEIYPAPTTIIVGENNAGKSNLIHALRLILDFESKRLVFELSEDDINNQALADGERFFSILLEIGNLQKHQELEAIFRDRISKDGEETYVTIEGKYELNEEEEYDWNIQVLSPEGRQNEPINFINRMSKSIPLFFLDPIRDARNELRTTGSGAFSQLLKDIELDDVEVEIIDNIKKANVALGKNQGITDLAKGITDNLSDHLPGGEGEASMMVATEDPSQLMRGLRMNLKCGQDCKGYDMLKHGTGLQNLVLIAMFRHRISKSTGITPILAIEEPEAHLHPQAQQCLLNDLMKIKNPVILTTHSPTFVKNTDPFGIIRFNLSKDNQVIVHQLDKTKITDDVNKSLRMIMRAGRSEVFFARTIIVVEGESELITLPVFAEKLGYYLGRDGISIVSADSNAFSNILLSCNNDNFAIPTVVTFDTDVLMDNSLLKEAFKAGLIDEATRNAGMVGDAELKKQTLENIGWFPAESNFEEEVAKAGYLQVILDVIEENGAKWALDDYLARNSLDKNPQGMSQFLKKTRTGRGLKISVARAIARNVGEIGVVPECYKKVISEAITKSV